MQTAQQQLQERVDSALRRTLTEQDLTQVPRDVLQVVPCANPQFGDYQFNGALPLARVLRTNPRELAQRVRDGMEVSEISEAPEIAGPGFVNFRLRRDFVEHVAAAALADSRLGIPLTEAPRRVVVDYSSPGVAKMMHVGHIRSTIIGDAITRLLRFAGHHVATDNHLGDWGTGFGKVILGWKRFLDPEALQRDPVGEMERLYKIINTAADEDETVADAARAETARLQAGNSENLGIWKQIRALSQVEFDRIYGRLGVTFDETLGESFYNDRLPGVVRDLKQRDIARDSEGAVIVTFSEPPQLVDKPLLIQKSDGAALYGTTDLAAIAYRVERWHPNEIIYVVDARQSLHFQQVFEAARRWGYDDVALRHVSFGTILGEDGKPLKTRSGDAVKLMDLLDEAEGRALEVVKVKSPGLTPEEQRQAARVIGISSVKYFDLAQNRTSDYVFSWDKMLSQTGNSAVRLHYAYVRTRSIARRAEAASSSGVDVIPRLMLEHPAEQELAKFILRMGLAVDTALTDYRPNALTDYLFELAQKFTAFYDVCPVVKSEEPVRSSRLALCRLTGDALQQGLGLLGIETIERM